MSTMAEEFPKQLARCRDLLDQYKAIGPVGNFGAAVVQSAIYRAEHAQASGDVVQLIQSYAELKELE